MASREASCSCGQLRLIAEGEAVRVSVCHCLDCQRRSGSAFAAPAFPAPTRSVWESRMHPRVTVPTATEHDSL